VTALGPSEAKFQEQVLDLAALYGWALRYHTRDSRRSDKGWPDLVLCRPPEILFVELKGPRTRPAAEQVMWLQALAACGLEVHLWRPADFDEMHGRLARPRPAVGEAA
jgi:hypothetical protein